jgi:DNA primase
MSLPDGFLDELRTRTSLSQVVGRKVMWDMRKSNQGKGDMWAPCPFHQEKTASFHVDDRKGYYYCFGCHAKGDAISFLRESENVSFLEAVEMLAREAGMTMPARDPKAQERSDRRAQLAAVLEQAVQHYRLQLNTAAGAAARDYLAGRGLAGAALERWEIGFAPDHRRGLLGHLRDKGVAEDMAVEAGLAIKPEDGGAAYDRFRGRIIFPIRDARGRAISLGGRAVDPNARAKYINGPETALFDKGRSLFNHGPAREAAGKGQPLIVAEGYMDVIALAEAGFAAAVAPLGTAITEDQLRLLWRIAPEPVIALDGDSAGLRAALRVIDLALPLLEAGQSLRFALMPEGMDPDDLIRAQGAAAMHRLAEGAVPMVQLLWRRETEGKLFDSPERKAALDKDLRAAIARIRDKSIRAHYGEEIKRLRWELFNADRPQKAGRGRGRARPAEVQPATRVSLLATGSGEVQEMLREAVVLATLIIHPELLEKFEPVFERLEMTTPDHRVIHGLILRHAHEGREALKEKIDEFAGGQVLEKLFGLSHVQITPALRHPTDAGMAQTCLAEELAKLEAARGARREIDEAARDLEALADEGLTWRLGQAAEARNRALRAQGEDKTTFDVADNGALMNREEREALERLLGGIDFTKGGRKGR